VGRTFLFSPAADRRFRVGLLALLAFVLGVPAAAMAWMRSPLQTDVGQPLEQPVEFDHRHHVRDDGIECRFCHYDAERSPNAGVPETSVCMGCHAQIWTDSPLLERVRASYFEKKPIAWRRVHDLPDFVFFDHSIHVRRGVGCESCHGRVDQMSRVYLAQPMQMQWCLECHRNPARHLRPPEFAGVMGYTPGEPQSVAGERLVRELGVSPPVHCTGCHR